MRRIETPVSRSASPGTMWEQAGQQALLTQSLDEPAVDAALVSGGRDGGDLARDCGGFCLEGRRRAHDCTAPPSSTSPWPLMPWAALEHRNVVSAATSVTVISRPCGLKPSSTLRAS